MRVIIITILLSLIIPLLIQFSSKKSYIALLHKKIQKYLIYYRQYFIHQYITKRSLQYVMHCSEPKNKYRKRFYIPSSNKILYIQQMSLPCNYNCMRRIFQQIFSNTFQVDTEIFEPYNSSDMKRKNFLISVIHLLPKTVHVISGVSKFLYAKIIHQIQKLVNFFIHFQCSTNNSY